ncbi:MAG: ABC transporter [Desulfobacteraceae bacterium 4572_88]|nr:MAG: ABC transporter [Desulfobacteraceae bacterium 4572_88]
MFSIRKIGVIGRTYRHLNRYRQILAILFKYGFGDLIERLNIDQYIEVGLQVISGGNGRARLEKMTTAERLRRALQELGPTYIKFGQTLSTRSDLIPADFMQELYQLQDNVPPRPFSEVRAVLESEFDLPYEEIFESFSETVTASASIGQVHKARLKDGGELVAVKVQRPGIRKVIEVDLEIMLHLATLVERHIEEMARHQPVRIVEGLARILEKETDYTMEAANMERFSRRFLGNPGIYIPKVFREMTTERILTMEFIHGIKISEVDRLDAAGLDRKKINIRGARFFLKQVFDHGFFHADPHPGNIRVLPGNVICMLDFGMVGSVDRSTREDFVLLLESMVRGNEAKATRMILRLSVWDHEPDVRTLEKDVSEFMGHHMYKSTKDMEIGKMLQHLLELSSRHHLGIPPDIFLMMKAFGTVEGISLLLDPDFNMVVETAPFIERIHLARFSPQRITEDLAEFLAELMQFTRQFPKDTLEITRLIRQQKLLIRLEHQGLDTILTTHDEISNKISFAIIIAALIIGSALIVIAKIPPLFFGISLVGIVLFFGAAILGVWLLVAILRRDGM